MKDPDVRHIIEIRVMRRVREYVTIIGYKEFNNLLLGTKG